MTNTNTRELVYLAGLLHDIGKFYPDFDTLWRELGFFHRASPEEQVYIDKANLWATKLDQQEDESGLIDQPLNNLFGEISINNKTGTTKQFGFRQLTLNADVVLQQTPGDLTGLREGFAADFIKLPTGNLSAFAGSLYHLLRQYTWCVPASDKAGYNTISLFHHLKLTGAFAQCFYDYELSDEPDKSPLPVQLLCVDLSGIQSFIYNIGSKYAAKSLKGRSFSLQALLDAIARKLIADTETTQSHLVYSSGGKFFMLLPNTAKINGILKNAENAVQQAIWEEYKGNLFVCFGRVPFDYNPHESEEKAISMATGSGSLSNLWQEVTRKAAEQKVQKNKALILNSDNFTTLFGPTGDGGETDQCTVTGWEGKLGDLVKLNDETKVHKTVSQQIKIGKALADARFMTFGNGPFDLLPKTLLPFDLDDRKVFAEKAEYSQIFQPKTNHSFLRPAISPDLTRSFRFYGGSQQALSIHGRNQPKNFEELAGIVRTKPDDDSPIWPEKGEGKYNRLAVLRMDVDSLGELFTKGLTGSKATFSAYATLSGLLDWFFSGYLNTIRAEYDDWVNIIYSGGDDVFAVGRWDKIIDFADQVQRDFKQFTGRPELTISAGIVLMRPRYPIGKAADQAGEAEDLAKGFNKEKNLLSSRHEKDAVCLFNVPVGWEEFATIRLMKNLWIEWLADDVLSKGILRSMFDWYEIATRLDKRTNQPLNYQSWRWNAAYSLARQRSNNPDSPRNKALDKLKLVLMCNQFTDETGQTHSLRFEAFIVASRWAELTFRDQLNTN